MGEMNIDNIKAQMRKGILEYCILSIISRNDAYASSIIAELKAAEMIVVEGTLYPLLTRQKNQGLLAYRWEESPQGPPRKYYSITEKGRQCLEQLDMAWTELISQIRTIREGAPVRTLRRRLPPNDTGLFHRIKAYDDEPYDKREHCGRGLRARQRGLRASEGLSGPDRGGIQGRSRRRGDSFGYRGARERADSEPSELRYDRVARADPRDYRTARVAGRSDRSGARRGSRNT